MLFISIARVIRVFSHKLRDDYISAFSAQAAFFIFISFFPFAMFLLSIMQFLPFTENEVMNACRSVFPAAIQGFVISIITELYGKATSTAILSVTLVATLWSSSKGFLSIIRGMNGVYANTETRNYIVIRIKSAIYTLLFAFMIILFLVIFVFGNQLYLWIVKRFPVLKEFALVIISVRTIVGLCLLIVFFLFMFMVIPNRKTKLIKELPGAILASCGWMIFSYLYSFYIDNMSNYSYTYGSLTAIVLAMIWLYTCMYMMFIGAEVNSVLSNPTVLAALKKLFSKNSVEE
ncbi:YihY/virulence factor BrkB family protein [Lachnoclostridium phytofermentans]|uniref:Ribonuclease BN n=1 Tax=Lachnoclostridium phytofermentans (strain ATCC 700394 / DSM 18823 / ISDg) TaxID=357809 RepID=A9KHY2_LACP7|nr:YihY/virulence factor BrkB family protein [Lachnoclostridium phytofermentans]ABX43829.1 ribonuclease BN [Lachnoclostridium phytofermentans ISDg]